MLPELSDKQIEALEQFRDLRIGFWRLRLRLWPRVILHKRRGEVVAVPNEAKLASVRVTPARIEIAKAKLKPDALRLWASVLLLTDHYDWDGEDEDAIAEELNRLAGD